MKDVSQMTEEEMLRQPPVLTPPARPPTNHKRWEPNRFTYVPGKVTYEDELGHLKTMGRKGVDMRRHGRVLCNLRGGLKWYADISLAPPGAQHVGHAWEPCTIIANKRGGHGDWFAYSALVCGVCGLIRPTTWTETYEMDEIPDDVPVYHRTGRNGRMATLIDERGTYCKKRKE